MTQHHPYQYQQESPITTTMLCPVSTRINSLCWSAGTEMIVAYALNSVADLGLLNRRGVMKAGFE